MATMKRYKFANTGGCYVDECNIISDTHAALWVAAIAHDTWWGSAYGKTCIRPPVLPRVTYNQCKKVV